MDYSKFRRSENMEQQTDPELLRDLLAAHMTRNDAPSETMVPNYPLGMTPQQQANPISQQLGARELLALIEALRAAPALADRWPEGMAKEMELSFPRPMPRPDPRRIPLPQDDPRYNQDTDLPMRRPK